MSSSGPSSFGFRQNASNQSTGEGSIWNIDEAEMDLFASFSMIASVDPVLAVGSALNSADTVQGPTRKKGGKTKGKGKHKVSQSPPSNEAIAAPSSSPVMTKAPKLPRIETAEQREARLMQRRVLIPLPRIPKRDIRRTYSTMFANVYNAANWTYLVDYMRMLFHPTDFTFTFQSPLPLTSHQLMQQVVQRISKSSLSSINNTQPGTPSASFASVVSPSLATNVMSSLVLNESIPHHLISEFFAQAFPDLVRLLSDDQGNNMSNNYNVIRKTTRSGLAQAKTSTSAGEEEKESETVPSGPPLLLTFAPAPSTPADNSIFPFLLAGGGNSKGSMAESMSAGSASSILPMHPTSPSTTSIVAPQPLPLPLQQGVIFGVDGLAKFWFDRMHDSPDLVFTPGPSQIKVRSDGTAVVKFLYTLSGHRHLYLPSLADSTGGAGAVGADGVDVFMKCVTSYFCPFEDQLVPLNRDGSLHLIVPADQRPVFTPSDTETSSSNNVDASASSTPLFGPEISTSPSPRPATPIGAALPSARSLVMPFVLGGVVTFHLDEQSLIRKFDMRYDLLK